MNIIDMIIVAILAFCLLGGMHRGSITSALKLLGFGGAWFGAQSMYAKVAHFALSNTTLMAVLNQYLEPASYFETAAAARVTVTEVVAGGEPAISGVVNSLQGLFKFMATAFSHNIRTEAFANLGINTVSQYLSQTFFVAVFNILAFLLTFGVLYLLVVIVCNMLDGVFSFPVLKHCDWLIGGVFGLLRGTVVIVLLLSIMPMLTNAVSETMTADLISQSSLYSFFSQFDLLHVGRWIGNLILG